MADTFSLDKTETLDGYADRIGNNGDTDDDGDGVLDTADAFPLDKSETLENASFCFELFATNSFVMLG